MQKMDKEAIYILIKMHANANPDKAAIIIIEKDGTESVYSWSTLLHETDKLSAYFKEQGLGLNSKIVTVLPNSLAAVVTPLAAWHIGACVFTLSSELPEDELTLLLEQINPDFIAGKVGVGKYNFANITSRFISKLPEPEKQIDDVCAVPARASATGGSTGIPKIIIEDIPMEFGPTDFYAWQMLTGQHPGQMSLICGSLHHSLFGNAFFMELAMGDTITLFKRFDDTLFLKSIAKYRVNCFVLVPTMMGKIYRNNKFSETDFSSVECMHHAGASCPGWLKQKWIERLGGEKIYEFYSMSEKVGIAAIRGDEWLAHPNSVGRPFGCEIQILDDNYQSVDNGVIGNVFFKNLQSKSSHYLLETQTLRSAPDGSVSVGDLGYKDDDGYVYLVDRRNDMIITGGKNVYSTEVENLIKEYPQVADALVIGLPDEVWGKRVHAIIEPTCCASEFKLYSFADFCFRQLSNYKLPKTIELIDKMPRDQSGKINKSKLLSERELCDETGSGFSYIKVPNGHQILGWRKKNSKIASRTNNKYK